MLLRLGLDVTALARSGGRYRDAEEAWNATVGWLTWEAGWGPGVLLDLQYRSFCGGCSLVSAMSIPAMAIWGPDLLASKLLALAWTAATLVLMFVGLRRVHEPWAWATLLLLALPFPGPQDLSLMLWGNHAELGLLLAAALALRGRPLAQGLTLGLALWFARTSLFFVPVLALETLLVAQRAGRSRLLLGLALGASLLLLPAGLGETGFTSVEPADHLLPEGLEGLRRRLALLLDPASLNTRLALNRQQVGPALVALAGASVGLVALAWRRPRDLWWLPALALAWVAAFSLTGFKVPLPGKVLPVVNLRYHAPWFLVLSLLSGLGVGLAWSRWRAAGVALLALQLGAVGWSHSQRQDAPRPEARDRSIVDLGHVVENATWRLETAALAPAQDPEAEAVLRLMRAARTLEERGESALLAGDEDDRRILGALLVATRPAEELPEDAWVREGAASVMMGRCPRGWACARATGGPLQGVMRPLSVKPPPSGRP